MIVGNGAIDYVFVGDLCPSGVYSQDIDIFIQALKELRGSLDQNAVLFFNLECSLFEGPTGSDTEANADALRALVTLQPAVANLSNNHHFDSGSAGSLQIRSILSDIGIPFVGLYVPQQPAFDVLTIGASKIALVCRTARGTHPRSFGSRAERILPIDHSEVVETCRALIGQYDFCIACLHWGAEYYLRPSPRQRRLADALVNLGVDVVWGQHAHVLQERRVKATSLVMYNMGNSIFGQVTEDRWPKVSSSAAMVGCRLSKGARVFWERRYEAGIRGDPLTVQSSIPLKRGSPRIRFFPLELAAWLVYRLYMEVYVFGGRFLGKRLRHRGPSVASSNEVAESSPNQGKRAGLKAVVRERIRRVVALWEDE